MESVILYGFYENGKITFDIKKLPRGKAWAEVKLISKNNPNYKKFQQLKGIWKDRIDIGTNSVAYINQLRTKIEKRKI